jgi:transglutaminase-like putative cysteine protease
MGFTNGLGMSGRKGQGILMIRTDKLICGVAFLLLLIASPRLARASADWLPVPPEDLAMKDNPASPGSDAMILYRESVVDVRKTNSDGDSDEEYFRIKVFTQEGTKQGHIEIPFDKGWEDISYVAGRTIRPDGSIVKFDGHVLETTAERGGGLKIFVKTFTLPDVQPGCIIEYKYQRQSKPHYVHDLRWAVSQSMYTREAHFTYIPYTGYGGLGLTPRYRVFLLPAGAVPTLKVDGSYSMVIHDIPGIEEESLMPPRRTLEARVEFYYEAPVAPSESDPTDKFWNHYAKKWDGQLEHFIDKKNALAQELSKIAGPGDPPETKLRKIYARVLQVRNLSMEDYRSEKEIKDENLKAPSNVEDVLSRGYAYSQQINNLFVGLARAAGFEATGVYVAPRNRDLFLPDRKEVAQLSADLLWVRAGSQEYYLDPSARYFPFGVLPWYETETGGIRYDKHGGTVVNTPNPVSSDATLVRHAEVEVKEDGSIEGKIEVDFTGQEGALLRYEKRKDDETGRTKDLADRIKQWLPVGSTFEVTKIANWDDIDQPVHAEGILKIPSFATSPARRMLMPLELFQAMQGSLFTTAKRVNPVYFRYPYEEIDDITLRTPAGFKVASLPKAQKVDLGAALYEISAVPNESAVEVKRHLAMKGVLFGKEAYPTLRAFFGMVKTDDTAQLVLENAQSAKNN